MWGEIVEDSPRLQGSRGQETFKPQLKPTVRELNLAPSPALLSQPEIPDDEDDRSRVISSVVPCPDAFFKSQQRGEPDLTVADKRSIAGELLDKSPSLFLDRFGKHLHGDRLAYFEQFRETSPVLETLREKGRARSKNRRFEAARRMVQGVLEGGSGSDYFSLEQMRQRDPLLFERLVGRFSPERPKPVDCSLANIILEHLDLDRERDLKRRQLEEEALEEFDDEDSAHDDGENEAEAATEEGRKEEFLQAMVQSFIDGRDREFDYSEVDDNSDYDDLNMRERDEEDKYFDQDDE